jgi:type I restriction enzyme S subunit
MTGELIALKSAEEEGLKSGKFLFDEHMILYSKIRPYLMKVARPEFCGLCSADIYPLSPIDGRLDRDFLFHVLLSPAFTDYAIAGSARAGMPKVNRDHLFDFAFSLPALPEQRRIVGILDEAFEAIASAKASAERNLHNARALFDACLQSVFVPRTASWSTRSFEECIESVRYTPKIERSAFLAEGRYPVVSQEAEFTNGYWDKTDDVFRVTTPVVIFGDHTKVLKYVDFDFVLGADGVKILVPKPFLDPKFFFHQLRSQPLKALGYSRHYRLLKELTIGYPVMGEQARIASELDLLDRESKRLASIYERKLAALDALKKSLLHQAFSGQL